MTDSMTATRGLVIASPWIDLILSGDKTWEMRSKATQIRGPLGLIRKGSGQVVGVATLTGCGASLSEQEMLECFDQHRIPAEIARSPDAAKWRTPWFLDDIHRLPEPVPYRHKSGAVTFVVLEAGVSAAIARQAGMGAGSGPARLSASGNFARESFSKQRPAKSEHDDMTGDYPRMTGQTGLTQGNINNNHFYLRPFFDRFPEDAVGGSNKAERGKRELFVDWGHGEPVVTDLDGAKRFFRARGWVGEFFRVNGARAGDSVQIDETAPYRYRVTLIKWADKKPNSERVEN